MNVEEAFTKMKECSAKIRQLKVKLDNLKDTDEEYVSISIQIARWEWRKMVIKFELNSDYGA